MLRPNDTAFVIHFDREAEAEVPVADGPAAVAEAGPEVVAVAADIAVAEGTAARAPCSTIPSISPPTS